MPALRSGDMCVSTDRKLELTKTENAQPGIFLVSWSPFNFLKRAGAIALTFQATAGSIAGRIHRAGGGGRDDH